MKEKEKHKKSPYLKNVDFKLTVEEKDVTKCYCGYTTYCDCSTVEPEQETLEEIFKKQLDTATPKLNRPFYQSKKCKKISEDFTIKVIDWIANEYYVNPNWKYKSPKKMLKQFKKEKGL